MSQSIQPCVGIYTDDPVACRALAVLIRSAGYAADCVRTQDACTGVVGANDLLVVGPGVASTRRELLVGQVGVPVLNLIRHGAGAGIDRGINLPWPSCAAELIRAINAARGIAQSDT